MIFYTVYEIVDSLIGKQSSEDCPQKTFYRVLVSGYKTENKVC